MILDTEIVPGGKYNIPLAFNAIFSRIPNELTPEEQAENPKRIAVIRLEWLILKYMHQFHNPDLENSSFYDINGTTLGNVLQLNALDRNQLDVMLAPLLINKNTEEEDAKLAADEVV